MIKFFRQIRQRLISENKFSRPALPAGRYLIYAIGEIVLVVIGILIALAINNWNERRREASVMLVNIRSIANDILNDARDMDETIRVLELQVTAGQHLIPTMESEQKTIIDSLAFILDFNHFTDTPIPLKEDNTWAFLNSSGIISEFPDKKLLGMLQDYYADYHSLVTNYTNTATPARLEIRKLKYELFRDSEHRKFFPTKTPVAPGREVYDSIFSDSRILPLCRYISRTAIYFSRKFKDSRAKAEEIVQYIDENFTEG